MKRKPLKEVIYQSQLSYMAMGHDKVYTTHCSDIKKKSLIKRIISFFKP